jgi:hypothetical protein
METIFTRVFLNGDISKVNSSTFIQFQLTAYTVVDALAVQNPNKLECTVAKCFWALWFKISVLLKSVPGSLDRKGEEESI